MMFILFIIISILSLTQNIETVNWGTENYSYVRYPDCRILNDGNIMPIVALGTFTPYPFIRNSDAIEQAVITAIEAGYRHIDTAPIYNDEGDIGNAVSKVIRRGIVTREELFITTKGTDVEYDILSLWRGMEMAKKLGLTMSIGVSNFNSSHINKILTYGLIRPAVNQIEINPTYTELELTAYCLREGIAVMSYAPFGFTVPRLFRKITAPPPTFNDRTLVRIARKYGKTTKQVLLRYLIDRGTTPITQSTNKDHIKENINIFDFRLTMEEVYLINEFNKNVKVYPNKDPVAVNNLSRYENECTIENMSKLPFCNSTSL